MKIVNSRGTVPGFSSKLNANNLTVLPRRLAKFLGNSVYDAASTSQPERRFAAMEKMVGHLDQILQFARGWESAGLSLTGELKAL